jgi:hypothetical protein
LNFGADDLAVEFKELGGGIAVTTESDFAIESPTLRVEAVLDSSCKDFK